MFYWCFTLRSTQRLHKTTNIVHKYSITLFMYNANHKVTLHLYFYRGQHLEIKMKFITYSKHMGKTKAVLFIKILKSNVNLCSL